MKIFDENMTLIENPDLTKGRVEQAYRPITHRYEIIKEETGHYETTKEYPNGGKDVEWVVDTPEEGHWITYDKNGNKIQCDIVVPDDAPHEIDINDIELFYKYVPYTEEELAEMEQFQSSNPTTEDVLNVLLGLEV